MNTFSLDISQSNTFKHNVMFNNEFLACFTNKKHALQIMRYLNWCEKRYGAFDDRQQAALKVHQSIKNAGLKIKFETINWF